jgi:hypothetical protein
MDMMLQCHLDDDATVDVDNGDEVKEEKYGER